MATKQPEPAKPQRKISLAELNENLMNMVESEVQKELDLELAYYKRRSYALRIHNRLNRMRYLRERHAIEEATPLRRKGERA